MTALHVYILRGACIAIRLLWHGQLWHGLPTMPPIVLIGSLAFANQAGGQSDNSLLAPPPRRAPAPAAATPPAALLPALLPTASPPAGRTAAAPSPAPTRDLSPAVTADPRSGLKVQKGAGILPNEHGQVWREYDISPYTLRVRDVAKPEQAIVDWILRETGTEVWFTEPLGILSASSTLLRVYHTPEMHDRVRSIVEQFVGGDVEAHALGLRLMTVGSPNWRVRALALLKPVDVKSPGVEAWLLSRENAAALGEQLKSRADFREHSAPHVEIANGQSQTLVRTQPRQYVRGVQLKREFPFYDSIPGKIDEGYSLEISPLLSLDGQTMEAAITCSVDQLEKLVPLTVDVPAGGQNQRVQIQVPQMVSWRLAERFRWPANEVLLLSCGVVASPAPGATGILSMLSPLGISGNRADALLMIEHRQPSLAANVPPSPPAATVPPIAKPAAPSASIGPPVGSASSVSRGRY
jgi:hypothetical protein